MKGSRKIILCAVAAMSLMAASPAFADQGRGNWNNHNDRGNNKSNNGYVYRNNDRNDHGRERYTYQRDIVRPGTVKIYNNDRIILNRYVQQNYQKSCRHGCGPYHQTGRRYIIGYPLPNNVVYYNVPYEVRSHLRPVPVGYQYVRVDNDVLLMNAATKQIIDAVTLLASISR